MRPDRREHLIHERFIRWACEHARLHEQDARMALKKLIRPAVGGGRQAVVGDYLML
jgi:hypothetical protein